MIIIKCDLCGQEPKDLDFSFEANKQEIITDLATGQKKLDKKLIQICKACYDKHIAKLLKYDSKGKKTK